MNVIRTLRTYMGMTQAELAKEVGITASDLSEMETKKPYGYPKKYQRLSEGIGVPMEALLKNKFTAIPESFFEGRREPEYKSMPTKQELVVAREGEEYILKRERERLVQRWPALSKLVLPFFKMKGEYPGFDILSFDDFGEPILLEVKTSQKENNTFHISQHELERATQYEEKGERYFVVYIGGWGTERQYVNDISYERLRADYSISPFTYCCRPISKRGEKMFVYGLEKFRKQCGMTQAEAADVLGVRQHELSMYENGQRVPNVEFYMEASNLFDATVDELMAEYDTTVE